MPPYARLLGCGKFGLLGALTEQFAIGSVYYYLTRDYEPSDDTWLGEDHGPTTVDMLQNMRFPALSPNDDADQVIRKCWYGEYPSVEELAFDVRAADNRTGDRAPALSHQIICQRTAECKLLHP